MMDKKGVIESYNEKWWQEIYKRIFGGVVYIEECIAECLHWNGGLRKLIEAGAIDVKNLSPFEYGNEKQKKAVFISQGTEININTIKEILKNSHFLNCILSFTVDSNILLSEINLTYAELEKHIFEVMPKKPCVVEIMFSPLFAISVTDDIFITTTFNTLYPKFGDQLLPNQQSNLDLHSLHVDEKNEVRRLATAVNNLLEFMNTKDDIFYMGAFSSVLAGVLEHLPEASNRRKSASKQATIIFIDRTVDLCGVTFHGSNSLLDKMVNLLPRFPGHTVDLAVDISLLCDANMVTIVDDIHLNPGCIAHSTDENCKQIFDHLINKSQTEVTFALYDKLTKITNTSPSKLPSRVTAQNLEKIISTFKGNYEMIESNSGLLQQSLAVIQTLKSPNVQEIELLSCLEKQVLQSITTSRDSTSVLSQISAIIKSSKQRGLSVDRILALLVHIYSLASGYIIFSEAQENNLHNSLSIAIFEDDSESSLKNIYNVRSQEDSKTFTHTIIKRLREITKIRDPFIKYKSVVQFIDKVSPSEYKSVLQQLICDMVDVKKPDMPDLKCRSTGFKDLLKSGFSMLMSSTKKNPQNILKHPFDNPTVIIFIIGGVTIEECTKIHRDIMLSGSDTNVIIGSTALVNPVEAMKQALLLNH